MTYGSSALVVVAALLCACGASDPRATPSGDSTNLDGSTLQRALPLQLVAEKKLSKLLPNKLVDHYEASGVAASDGMLYVAFDNLTQIAAIDTSLTKGKLGPGEVTDSQYEAITASDDGRFYAMIEAESDANGLAELAELDGNTAFAGKTATDASFEHSNKGFEGAAFLRVAGQEYVLALCENNLCKDDDSPAGEGRVLLLALTDGIWTTQARLKLPESVAFLNYSDISLANNGDDSYTVAVVSHKSSAVWLGTLSTSPWALTGPSKFYVFPRSAEGAVRYCSVEGITFLGPSVLAAVSDKSDGEEACADEEESIHIFQMP